MMWKKHSEGDRDIDTGNRKRDDRLNSMRETNRRHQAREEKNMIAKTKRSERKGRNVN